MSLLRWHGGAVVTSVISYKIGSKFEPASQLESFCVEVSMSSHACEGFLRALWFPPTTPKHTDLNSYPKF